MRIVAAELTWRSNEPLSPPPAQVMSQNVVAVTRYSPPERLRLGLVYVWPQSGDGRAPYAGR